MLKIYFDGHELGARWIRSLVQEASSFDSTFKLGSTVCRVFTLEIDKRLEIFLNHVIETHTEEELETDSLEYLLATTKTMITDYNPQVVTLKEDDNLYATLFVDEVSDEYNAYYKYTLADVMVKLNTEFVCDIDTPTSVKDLALMICDNHGIELVTQSFFTEDMMVNWNQKGMTERDFIGYIAEVNSGYAYINATGNLVIKPYDKSSMDIVKVEDCSSFKLGSKHLIDRVYVELADATSYYPETSDNETVYLNSENILITDSGNYSVNSIVQRVQENITGFTFYDIKVDRCPIDNAIICGDLITFVLDGKQYDTIAQIKYTYGGSWYGGYELALSDSEQIETKVLTSSQKAAKQIRIIVDRELNQTKTEILEEVANEYATQTALTQTATNISMNFISKEKNEKQEYIDEDYKALNRLETSIVFDSDGINISDSKSQTNLQLSSNGVTISGYGSDEDITAMQPNQFQTGQWIMQQGGNYFNIFKKH